MQIKNKPIKIKRVEEYSEDYLANCSDKNMGNVKLVSEYVLDFDENSDDLYNKLKTFSNQLATITESSDNSELTHHYLSILFVTKMILELQLYENDNETFNNCSKHLVCFLDKIKVQPKLHNYYSNLIIKEVLSGPYFLIKSMLVDHNCFDKDLVKKLVKESLVNAVYAGNDMRIKNIISNFPEFKYILMMS